MTTKSNSDWANELYLKHVQLGTEPKAFRGIVCAEIRAATGCSPGTSGTLYNNARKLNPVDGIGRAAPPVGVVKPGATAEVAKVAKAKKAAAIQDDDECFSVLELVKDGGVETVGRCQSFLMQGDASECFDSKTVAWPNNVWVLIKGLGSISGTPYKLEDGEREITRYFNTENE